MAHGGYRNHEPLRTVAEVVWLGMTMFVIAVETINIGDVTLTMVVASGWFMLIPH